MQFQDITDILGKLSKMLNEQAIAIQLYNLQNLCENYFCWDPSHVGVDVVNAILKSKLPFYKSFMRKKQKWFLVDIH